MAQLLSVNVGLHLVERDLIASAAVELGGGRAPFPELADKGVEGGRKHEAEGGDPDHPEQHRSTEGLAHLRACPGRHGEREDTEDKGEGGLRIGRRRVWAADVAASSG